MILLYIPQVRDFGRSGDSRQTASWASAPWLAEFELRMSGTLRLWSAELRALEFPILGYRGLGFRVHGV